MREIIEVNGVRYDAITGQKIEISNKSAASSAQDMHNNLQEEREIPALFYLNISIVTDRGS